MLLFASYIVTRYILPKLFNIKQSLHFIHMLMLSINLYHLFLCLMLVGD